jgi:hypothetical protein
MPSQPRELNEARGLIGDRKLIQVLRYIKIIEDRKKFKVVKT